MILRHYNKQLDGEFCLSLHEPAFDWEEARRNKLIHILWNHSDQEVLLEIDGYRYPLPPESIITTTFYHEVSILEHARSLVIFSFNREYYCIHDHDKEVSCYGIIFSSTQEQLVMSLNEEFQRKLRLLLEVFIDEFQYKDTIQGEMLLMLLKRLIIICTRLAKDQNGLNKKQTEEVDVVRRFNFLVDKHFRTVKTVKEYADLMYKSPKTLSNIFSKTGDRTPLQIIHERIVLEARRLLSYTDKNINEIAFDLGFEEAATFFKMFKKHMKESPQSYRNKLKKGDQGTIAI